MSRAMGASAEVRKNSFTHNFAVSQPPRAAHMPTPRRSSQHGFTVACPVVSAAIRNSGNSPGGGRAARTDRAGQVRSGQICGRGL